jgi:hypothetical protein
MAFNETPTQKETPMNKTELAKALSGFVIGGITANVVKQIIRNNTDPEAVADKAAVLIASFVLGAIAADATKAWTDRQIDELIVTWKKLTSKEIHTTV